MQEPKPATPFALKDSFGPGGNFLLALARLMAIIGGLIFVGLVLMSVVSIVGRKTVGFVVPGDVEVLQMLAAAASASFFPYCHLLHGDIKVDFFTHNMKQKTLWIIDAFGSLLGINGITAWLALTKCGRQRGVKLWSESSVHRQPKRVLTIHRSSLPQASSWMSMSPVTWICLGR